MFGFEWRELFADIIVACMLGRYIERGVWWGVLGCEEVHKRCIKLMSGSRRKDEKESVKMEIYIESIDTQIVRLYTDGRVTVDDEESNCSTVEADSHFTCFWWSQFINASNM